MGRGSLCLKDMKRGTAPGEGGVLEDTENEVHSNYPCNFLNTYSRQGYLSRRAML